MSRKHAEIGLYGPDTWVLRDLASTNGTSLNGRRIDDRAPLKHWISGRVAIDFVHTGGGGFRARWEAWHSAKDLAEWMAECPRLNVHAPVNERDLVEGRALRGAIWHAAQAVLRGERIPDVWLRVIERAAARPDLVPLLRDGALAWAADASGEQVLSTVARDAIGLSGSEVKTRLRKCKRPNCFLLFVDTSRPGKRAWCTPAGSNAG